MFGRRSHARFALSPSSEGLLRVLYDVSIQSADTDEIVAISREVGVVDEMMLIRMPDDDADVQYRVQVIDSRPIVVDGTVRHRLRLRHVDGAAVAGTIDVGDP